MAVDIPAEDFKIKDIIVTTIHVKRNYSKKYTEKTCSLFLQILWKYQINYYGS